jgi:NADH-quinone oxidoreductase subunit F
MRHGVAGAPPGGAPATTKVVTVTGDVARQCTLQVPLGTSMAAVIEQVEGRPLSELDIKAVQFGGPTGRFFAGDGFATPITYEDLERAGAVMGSAAIEVFGSGRCAVEMARDATARLHEESCGKCVFCREGTRQLLDILNDISECRADEKRVELLRELGEAMKTGSICDIGRGAALPVLSALELFGEDFKSHLEQKRCAGKTT